MYEKPVLQQLKEQGEEENRHNTDSDQEPVAQVSVLDIPLHVINNEQPPPATREELLDVINKLQDENEQLTQQIQDCQAQMEL